MISELFIYHQPVKINLPGTFAYVYILRVLTLSLAVGLPNV